MNRTKAHGFTVVELMISMAILATLAAISASYMIEYIERTKLKTAVDMVDAHIRQTRWNARLKSETCYIVFNPNTSSYVVNGNDFVMLPSGVNFGVDQKVTGKPNQPYDAPPSDGISFDSGSVKNTATFYPTGTVAPTGSVFITNGQETMAITVALTGRPKIWRSAGGSKWIAL